MSKSEKIYKVKQGDCISSIAESHGFFWETLWNSNKELKEKRKDPNVLNQEDEVKIPELRVKKESGATDSKHTFRKKGVPAKLRLIIEKDDLPIENTDYLLKIDGILYEGTTDNQGLIEHTISPCASEGILEIADFKYQLTFGAMNPLDDLSGVQTRLQNLGFYDGAIDGKIGPMSQEAIAYFQAFSEIEVNRELDDETRQQLFDRQDKRHETSKDNSEPEQEQNSAPNSDEDENTYDDDELDEEKEFPDYKLEKIEDESDGDGGV